MTREWYAMDGQRFCCLGLWMPLPSNAGILPPQILVAHGGGLPDSGNRRDDRALPGISSRLRLSAVRPLPRSVGNL